MDCSSAVMSMGLNTLSSKCPLEPAHRDADMVAHHLHKGDCSAQSIWFELMIKCPDLSPWINRFCS